MATNSAYERPRGHGFQSYHRYTVLILAWAVLLSAYIFLLEMSSCSAQFKCRHNIMGPRGTNRREQNFAALAFFRSALTVAHVPVMTATLASFVPWMMQQRPTESMPSQSLPDHNASASEPALDDNARAVEQQLSRPSSTQGTGTVVELFLLADRTWAGVFGWCIAATTGVQLKSISKRWWLLAVIAGCSYIGFPLLAFAYTFSSAQRWESRQITASVAAGGLKLPYSDTLSALRNGEKWMRGGPFVHNLTDSGGFGTLSSFESPGDLRAPLHTPLFEDINAEFPSIGFTLTSASCGSYIYNSSKFVSGHGPQNDTGGPTLSFSFHNNTASNVEGLYSLRCNDDCSKSRANNSICSSWSTNRSPQLCEDYCAMQTLSCASIESSEDLNSATATIQLAVQNPSGYANVRWCNISVSFSRATINTLSRQYTDPTTSYASTVLQTTPAQLLNLSMESFVHFFHYGLGDSSDILVSNGFLWFTNSERKARPLPLFYTAGDVKLTSPMVEFYEFGIDCFIVPLATLIRDVSFFQNGSVAGVVFKSEVLLSYGVVSRWIAIAILFAPVGFTLLLSLFINSKNRWTSTLDSFALFKLGADWKSYIREMRLSTISEAGEPLKRISGKVEVNPSIGQAQLDYVSSVTEL
ncbi:hypothetical protein BKA65DRAFT_518889 [Rhexocercosporidium sp. MPI-PUGE-AT-0058]|nr:hypothetical protein BKA65DRAFT_518889 [Rhexocercosporidium sp. MPI-PUGE-AT-0058]